MTLQHLCSSKYHHDENKQKMKNKIVILYPADVKRYRPEEGISDKITQTILFFQYAQTPRTSFFFVRPGFFDFNSYTIFDVRYY